MKYEVVKRWVTGERAEQDHVVIETQLETLIREYMELSGQRKFYGHKSRSTDLGAWKFARAHINKHRMKFDVFRCPLRSRCGCEVSMLVVIGPDFIELQRYGLHDKNSHDNDQSKKLTYNQIVNYCFGGGGRQDCAYAFRRRAPQEFV